MPTYEYECTNCNHQWEEDQKISDPPISNCPNCKKKKAKRLIAGSTTFVLQGSGWASEGYK